MAFAVTMFSIVTLYSKQRFYSQFPAIFLVHIYWTSSSACIYWRSAHNRSEREITK